MFWNICFQNITKFIMLLSLHLHKTLSFWTLCMSSLEKCLFKPFARFLIGLLVFLEWGHVSSLYILKIKPLSEVSLTNMFSRMVGSLFILILFSWAMQKLFILMRSHFFYSFLSVPCSRGHISENTAAWNIWDFPSYVLLIWKDAQYC